LTRGDTECYL